MRIKGSAVSDPAFFVSNPGDRFAPVYSSAVRADGTISVVQSDSIDLQAKYNSLRSTTDMSYILARLKLGDQSVLNVKHGTFGDFSAMPTNMAEYLQLAIDGEMVFNRLPKDTRAKFDFDFNKWLSSIGTDSWIESMSAFLPGLEKVSRPSEVISSISDSVEAATDLISKVEVNKVES